MFVEQVVGAYVFRTELCCRGICLKVRGRMSGARYETLGFE